MSIQSQDVFANATTLLTAISDAAQAANTLNTVTIVGGSDDTRPIPLTGLFLQPDINTPTQSAGAYFLPFNQTTSDLIPYMTWSRYYNAAEGLYPTVFVGSRSSTIDTGGPQDMGVANLYLGADGNVPIGSDGISVTTPYSSIAGISSINGVNWGALMSTVNGLPG